MFSLVKLSPLLLYSRFLKLVCNFSQTFGTSNSKWFKKCEKDKDNGLGCVGGVGFLLVGLIQYNGTGTIWS